MLPSPSRLCSLLLPVVCSLVLSFVAGMAKAQGDAALLARPDASIEPEAVAESFDEVTYVGRSSAESSPHLPRLKWKSQWRSFDAYDWVLTGISGALLLTLTALGPDERDGWRGGILFDENARDLLRAPTERSRRVAREISDVLLITSISYPIFVDALLVTAWLRDSPDVAVELTLINIQTLLFTAALQTVANMVASRERPYGRTCGGELREDTTFCDSQNRFQSFFSGHTSQTFAAAALTCTHHAHLPLYGGGGLEWVPCFLGFGMAAATGMLRVVGDQHYVTDVLTGAVVGTLSGFLVPWLLHYRSSSGGDSDPRDGDAEARRNPSGPQVLFTPLPTGAGLIGAF